MADLATKSMSNRARYFSSLGTHIARFWNFFLDIILPQNCLFCGKEGELLCPECQKDIGVHEFFTCPVCQKRLPRGKICDYCRSKILLSRFFAAAPYHDQKIKRMIQDFKYNGVRELAKPLSIILTEFLEKNNFSGLITDRMIIAPIPLHKSRLKDRGFNQSEEIAKLISEHFKIPLAANAISRIRATPNQADIKETDLREKNVQDAFACENPDLIRRKIVILLDDVYTSGSTIQECAKILKAAGAKEIWGMAIAKG